MKKLFKRAGGFSVCSLFLAFTMFGTISYADPAATAGSTSGALSGAQSQAGSIGYIDNGTHTVEASNLKDNAPGVFSAGVTAGGSNPCVVSIGGGLSVPGGGINFANAYNDKGCDIRENLRLMAAISSSAEVSNQVLLREISCQSVVYWDAFERTYDATGDSRYFCANERPEDNKNFIAGRLKHNPRTQNMAYDLDGGNSVKHQVVSSMLSQGYEDDAFSMLMED